MSIVWWAGGSFFFPRAYTSLRCFARFLFRFSSPNLYFLSVFLFLFSPFFSNWDGRWAKAGRQAGRQRWKRCWDCRCRLVASFTLLLCGFCVVCVCFAFFLLLLLLHGLGRQWVRGGRQVLRFLWYGSVTTFTPKVMRSHLSHVVLGKKRGDEKPNICCYAVGWSMVVYCGGGG